jgi:hypothetical protein
MLTNYGGACWHDTMMPGFPIGGLIFVFTGNQLGVRIGCSGVLIKIITPDITRTQYAVTPRESGCPEYERDRLCRFRLAARKIPQIRRSVP